MANKLRTLAMISLYLSLLGLAACGSPAPTSTPTTDLNPFRTEVASTVYAQVTQDLALTPSITPLPSPTDTSTPTATSTATLSAALSPTGTPATSTPSTGTPKPGTLNLAQWVSQSIADDTIFGPGESFSMTWRIKNAGTSTWTAAFMLRFYAGDNFGAPKEIPLGREVAPGDTIDITVKMKTPTVPGNYRSDWVMASESRGNFKEAVYLKITIAITATPSRTAIPSSTPKP